MADRWWNGVNGNWTDTSNWSATRYGSTGQTVPGSSDVAYVMDGAVDITSNISAVTAGTIVIGGEFAGNISGMLLDTTTCAVDIKTVNRNRIVIGAAASKTISGVMNIRNTGQGEVQIASGASGVITTVRCGARGTVKVLGSGVVTNLYSAGIRIIAEYAATAFTILQLRGGSGHEISRGVTTLTLDAGALGTVKLASAVGTANVVGRSRYTHDSTGTITAIEVTPGSVAIAGAAPFTVTDSTVWETGSLFDNNSNAAYTNATVVVGETKA